jgi:hypothetical protein
MTYNQLYKLIKDIPRWYYVLDNVYNEKVANKMCELANYYEKIFVETEKDYYESETIKVKKEIKKWVDEYTKENYEWAFERRNEFLSGDIKNKNDEISDILLSCAETKDDTLDLFIENEIDNRKKIINKYKGELKHKWDNGKITDEMIENARNYPIEQIIEVNEKGFAICPFHDDKNPSAFCKNNYLHCFSCGENADVIKLYMHLNNTNFIQSVKELQC